MPDGFQFQRFLYFSEIGGVGYAVGRWQAAESEGAPTLRGRFKTWSEGLRRAIGERIAAVIPGDEGAVGSALVNGEQNAIPDDLQEAYRASGIAHLLSISGVHMSLLAGLVFFIVRRVLALLPSIALRIDTKKVAAVAGLAATAFYLVISGMSVPAVRSFMMIAVVMLAVLLDRTALSLRTVAWAALVLLVLYPDSVFGASFQMSFIAVLALIALYEQAWLRSAWRNAEGELNLVRIVAAYVAGLVVTDIVAGGTTALFAAYHFNRLPTYSAFTNLFAVPLTGLWIMPAGILGLLLMPFGWEALPFKVMGAGVAMLNDLARMVAAWPYAQFHVPPLATWAMALAALGIVWLCLWRGPRRWAGLALVMPALLQPYFAAQPDVIVDDSARVFAVSGEDGRLVLRPGRTGRFVREAWTERHGESGTKWRDVAGLTCDSAGCVLERGRRKVLLAFTAEALAEDCGVTDIAVSAVASRDLCRNQPVVDIIDLKREGTLAIWMGESGVRKRSVRDATGDRVWMRGVVENTEDGVDEIEP
jgi:competence protein ComEC